MALTLLMECGTNASTATIGKQWVYRFLKKHPELDAHLARNYDVQRAKNEDPKIINKWFQCVQQMREEYGILDEDVYNFDETGFAMGVARAGSSKVVTASTSVGRIMVIQPGNHKWVTVIECINASGWALPPFVILEGKVHLTAWYKTTIPSDWMITISENGWTNDALGFQWIQHFDKWTKQCTTGKY